MVRRRVAKPTLCSDRLWDGTRVTQTVGIDGSDDEQVDGVGLEAADGVSFYLDHVSYSLPRAAGWLAANQCRRKSLVNTELSIIKCY